MVVNQNLRHGLWVDHTSSFWNCRLLPGVSKHGADEQEGWQFSTTAGWGYVTNSAFDRLDLACRAVLGYSTGKIFSMAEERWSIVERLVE